MMKKLTTALSLFLALALASPAFAINANDPTVNWTVTGTICGVPNAPACVTFSCVVNVATPGCATGVNGLNVQFVAPSTTTFGIVFLSKRVCSASSCIPVLATTDAAPAAVTVAGTTTLTASQSFRAYFPISCEPCFNGAMPSFTVSWSGTTP